MANKKISQLTALGANFGATDLFEISKDVGAGAFESKKITGAEMISSISTDIAIGDTVTSGTQGSVLFLGAAGVLAQDNAKFFWDDTNDRLGIGTSSPSFALHVLDSTANLDTKFESNGGHSRFIIDSTGADDSILQFNEGNARRWSIYTDGTDDSLKITRSDVPTASPTSDAIAIDSTDNVSIPNGTLTINDYTFPAADGSANQVLQTDGAGALSFAAASGGATDLNGLTDVKVQASSTSGRYSIFINGATAGAAPQTGTLNNAQANYAIGKDTLKAITTGDFNVGIGFENMTTLTTESNGKGNVTIGYKTGRTLTGEYNVCIGYDAGSNISGGDNIVAIGRGAMGNSAVTNGLSVCIGYNAGNSQTSAQKNVMIGADSGTSDTTGYHNTFVGYDTGDTITEGHFNLFLGSQTDGVLDADYQTAIGYKVATTQEKSLVLGREGVILLHGDYANADETKLGINLGTTFSAPTATLHVKGQGNTYASANLLITNSDDNHIMKLTDDGGNIAIGLNALDSLTGGSGTFNIGLGSNAGTAVTTGDNNIMLGNTSGAVIAGGSDNICIGYYAGGLGLSSASYNVLIGRSAGISNNGASNVAVGYETIRLGTSVSECVAIGYYALRAVTGDNNIGIGYKAGDNITSGTDNIIIGTDLDASSATVVAELNIGGHIIGSMAAADRYTKFTGQVYTPTSTLTDGATITPDFTNGNVFTVTLAGNRTLANPTNPKDGATYCIIVKQDGTGSRTLAYGGNYKWEGGTAPTLSTGANAVDILTFISDGTNMYGAAALNFS